MRLLKHELHLPEQLIQRFARIDHFGSAKVADTGRAVARSIGEDVAKAAARLQSRGAKRQREVIDQKRPVGHTQTVIETDVVANVILKQHQLQRLGAMKAQIVHVDDCFHALRQLDVDAGVVNEDAGIDEVRLSLNLAAAQRRQKTVRLDQAHTRLRQTNSVAHPKRKLPASEVRIVEDGVEASGSSIRRIPVSLSPQKRAFKS